MRALPLALLIVACQGQYDVRLSFADASTKARAGRVQVALVEDCASQSGGTEPVNPTRIIEFNVEEEASALGSFDVDRDSYGLMSRAFDEDCNVIAYGCTPVSLEAGADGQLVVQLANTNQPRCSPTAMCSGGQCIGIRDGGVDAPDVVNDASDASTDTGPDSGALSDAGPDVPDAGLPGPVAYYSCDALAGSSMIDESGNEHTATCTDCPSIQMGSILGSFCVFDGIRSHFRVARTAALDPSDGFSFSAFVQPMAVEDSTISAMPRATANNNTWQLVTRVVGTASVATYISRDSAERHQLTGPAIPMDAWTHIAVTYNGTVKRIYIDGVLTEEMNGAQEWDEMHGILIGADENSGSVANHFEGFIDEIRIHDRALEPVEVAAFFALGS
ncbi:MAG: hypothetical protein ACI9KE_004012 [Polyangiales bacterium]|jgi:hypothetical protein